MVRLFCRAGAARAGSASPSERAALTAVDSLRSEALPKQKRLTKRREFVRVYETGLKLFSRYSVLFIAPNGLAHSRIGITATKKLGKASVRNRFKRWTRETYRRQREPLGLDAAAVDIVVNVKPNAADCSFDDFTRDLSRVLGRVVSETEPRAPRP